MAAKASGQNKGVGIKRSVPFTRLHAFLVKSRRYRGSVKEFRPQDENDKPYIREVRMYASALKVLAPDIVADCDDVFSS